MTIDLSRRNLKTLDALSRRPVGLLAMIPAKFVRIISMSDRQPRNPETTGPVEGHIRERNGLITVQLYAAGAGPMKFRRRIY